MNNFRPIEATEEGVISRKEATKVEKEVDTGSHTTQEIKTTITREGMRTDTPLGKSKISNQF